MKNCLVAQSGGPTSVINASVVGVVNGNKELKGYDNVYGGINGIEGILQSNIINLSKLTDIELEALKYTPSSSLGSCRYKMKDFKINDEEYKRLFAVLDSFDIQTLFYIGGNDSMDTVNKLSEYAKLKGIDKQIIGIPKTIDNDLYHTDHTPGYGSAAKFIATTVLETYLDSSVYINNGIFIIETMGRDTGWLAASAALAKINGEAVVDFIYLPEAEFSEEQFLKDVAKRFNEKNKVYIVASEGIKDGGGRYLFKTNFANKHDSFSHVQLGGVGNYLKRLIIENHITSRVKVLELGVTQRSAMHCVSQTDIEEAYKVGKAAVKYSIQGHTGLMVGMKRIQNNPYTIETYKIEASKVANNIKYFPAEWITAEKNNVTKEAVKYIYPLILGSPNIIIENGLPKYLTLYDKYIDV
ncbi:6-phosphofructokinase [Paramaledivibacter caminithermalis]|jgi:6-phosphofructokinase 1|uniref:Pyrophosphate--fructose 6-phosphate 1-phosphotransferase n=1 Tax=Paramaledivibacter caminithermalis (strain DSM 15212 / CIP 107654 / DViRD3) TaxID=1121301 RepID=A0A1M6K945_PARC5|nr:6-phosphofructokinase [Paramaledivibacter caminithermalis]SHJ55476.1 6-phosphofructokinase 1 [Paramaledivibacter caminithermalis DSM 15212]